MERALRTAIAIMAAAGTFPLLLMVVGGVVYFLGETNYAQYFTTAAWAFVFIFPVAVVLGLPIHLIARRRGVAALNRYLIGGLVLGLIVAGLVFLSFPSGFRALKAFGLGAGVGVVSAFVFWLTAGVRKKFNPI